MPLGYGHPIPSPVLHVPPDRLRSALSSPSLPFAAAAAAVSKAQ